MLGYSLDTVSYIKYHGYQKRNIEFEVKVGVFGLLEDLFEVFFKKPVQLDDIFAADDVFFFRFGSFELPSDLKKHSRRDIW